MLTSTRRGLDRAEFITTAAAVVASSGFYVVFGHRYLARGVLGDLLGLSILTGVVLVRRGRLRHEALVCLLGIALVCALGPEWPLAIPGAVWWALVATGVAGYVSVRHRRLPGRHDSAPSGLSDP
ncbi:MAG: hypothetical protein M3357_08670 [Actinomycetota bacterium]|nr:hypothetical protein [Actinomycetota bacterium]